MMMLDNMPGRQIEAQHKVLADFQLIACDFFHVEFELSWSFFTILQRRDRWSVLLADSFTWQV